MPEIGSILIVEADPVQRDLIRLALSRLPVTLFQTADGSAVQSLVEKHHPDMVVMDLFLPGTNGLDILRQGKSQGWLKRTAVIAISSLVFEEVVTQAASAGAAAFLAKPIDTDLLVARVQQILMRKRSSLEGFSP